MLSKPAPPPIRQQGITLIIALVILVMITLASVALIRSLDATNLIAGNLAFQQSAAQSGDEGIEAAITWLEQNNTAGTLVTPHNSVGDCKGYTAHREDPAAGTTWDTWWSNLGVCQKVNLATDAAGNTVSYTIHRLCQGDGALSNVPSPNCSISPVVSQQDSSGSRTAQAMQLNSNNQLYYRITARISGPRWTKTYIQAIVAL